MRLMILWHHDTMGHPSRLVTMKINKLSMTYDVSTKFENQEYFFLCQWWLSGWWLKLISKVYIFSIAPCSLRSLCSQEHNVTMMYWEAQNIMFYKQVAKWLVAKVDFKSLKCFNCSLLSLLSLLLCLKQAEQREQGATRICKKFVKTAITLATSATY